MGNEQVNLSTGHQYWRVIRDFVEPAVRDVAESAGAEVLIDRESLVLQPDAEFYSFDISPCDRPLERWRISYVLDCPTEKVHIEAVQPDFPYMKPIPVCERGVDDFDKETANEDIRTAIGIVRGSSAR